MNTHSQLAALAMLTASTTRAFADVPDGYGYGHMMWGGYGFGGALTMLVFWGLVIAAIVFVVRWVVANDRAAPGRDNSERILRERFANGEIDEEEFERRKRALGGD